MASAGRENGLARVPKRNAYVTFMRFWMSLSNPTLEQSEEISFLLTIMPCHTGQESSIETTQRLDWLTCSPAANSTEHVWNMLQTTLFIEIPSILGIALKEEWNNFPQR